MLATARAYSARARTRALSTSTAWLQDADSPRRRFKDNEARELSTGLGVDLLAPLSRVATLQPRPDNSAPRDEDRHLNSRHPHAGSSVTRTGSSDLALKPPQHGWKTDKAELKELLRSEVGSSTSETIPSRSQNVKSAVRRPFNPVGRSERTSVSTLLPRLREPKPSLRGKAAASATASDDDINEALSRTTADSRPARTPHGRGRSVRRATRSPLRQTGGHIGSSASPKQKKSLLDRLNMSDTPVAQPNTWVGRKLRLSDQLRLHVRQRGFSITSAPTQGQPDDTVTMTWAKLRDVCPCPRCVHPTTRQKTHTSGEAHRIAAALASAPWADDFITVESTGIRVRWPEAGGIHESLYPVDHLREAVTPHRHSAYLEDELRRRLWLRSDLDQSPNLHVEWRELCAKTTSNHVRLHDDVLLRVLAQLQTWGLVVIRGLPSGQANERMLTRFAAAFDVGPALRHTFYGETWDVKNKPDSRNVAYTDLNLGLHMDLLYFSQPPRFQLLHCLRNRVIGGASYFVDAFRAAHDFARSDPDNYAVLAQQAIPFEYDNDGHFLLRHHRILPNDIRKTYHRLPQAVFWSPPFQGRLHNPSFESERLLYKALDEFQHVLDRPEARYELTLREGDLVLFDNQRVLHARRAFRDKTPDEHEQDGTTVVAGEPSRWLKGGYMDGEVVWDKLAMLHEKLSKANKA